MKYKAPAVLIFIGLIASVLPALAFAKNGSLTVDDSKTADVAAELQALSDFLDHLSAKIDALPDPPTEITIGNTDPTLAPKYLAFGFGGRPPISPFDGADAVLKISASEVQAPAAFVSLDGLEAPFSFKGGHYPGEGGTCGAVISPPCSMAVSFNQDSGTGGADNGSGLRYKSQFILTYNSGGRTKHSNPIDVVAQAVKVSELSSTFYPVASGGLNRLDDARVGGSSRPASVTLFSGGPVKLTGLELPSAPFSVTEDSCTAMIGKVVGGFSCKIGLVFKPTAVATAADAISVRYAQSAAGAEKTQKVTFQAEGLARTGDFILSYIGKDYTPVITQKIAFDPGAKNGLSAENNLLVVYNGDVSESAAAKDYYLANRPSFGNANVLALHYTASGEENNFGSGTNYLVTPQDFSVKIKQPIIDWISAHPDKDIRYIVLMPGLPSTFTDSGFYDASNNNRSVDYALSLNGAATKARVTRLDMGSLQQTESYIDKLKAMYALMPSPNTVISANGTGKFGTTYYFDDARAALYLVYPVAKDYADALISNDPAAKIVQNDAVNTMSNVAGYFGWGVHAGWPKSYALDGSIKMTGNSGWYVINTNESFNGMPHSLNGSQSTFQDWFSSNAFGGLNYSNTPVGAVVHTEEPGGTYAVAPDFYSCWNAGQLFADCASLPSLWKMDAALGDPWVTR